MSSKVAGESSAQTRLSLHAHLCDKYQNFMFWSSVRAWFERTCLVRAYEIHKVMLSRNEMIILLDFSLTVKAAALIFISGCGSAISSAKEGKSGFIYNLVKSKYAF